MAVDSDNEDTLKHLHAPLVDLATLDLQLALEVASAHLAVVSAEVSVVAEEGSAAIEVVDSAREVEGAASAEEVDQATVAVAEAVSDTNLMDSHPTERLLDLVVEAEAADMVEEAVVADMETTEAPAVVDMEEVTGTGVLAVRTTNHSEAETDTNLATVGMMAHGSDSTTETAMTTEASGGDIELRRLALLLLQIGLSQVTSPSFTAPLKSPGVSFDREYESRRCFSSNG